MAQAKEASLRLKIIAGRGEGASYAALARDYKVNYHTVRTLCLRYEAQGESALRPNYSKCG
ncbi:MAG: helix-turn-helix domain-containing protein, partial [Candidatus Omnitrophica bacterium]|nr:helix-turn-helix domain-containing protein [Candidatus Omnitrophota bacterium]